MPTGYTAELMEKGETFERFALRCARAFGALVLMRDEPLGAPIPEKFEPSDHHAKALATARTELERLLAMGENDRTAFGETRRQEEIENRRRHLRRSQEQDARLKAMREQVVAWTPPTPDHTGLREFMLQQIELSYNGDFYERYLAEAEVKTPAAYYEEAVTAARRSIKYNTEEHAKEVQRTETRSRWIADLRKSL